MRAFWRRFKNGYLNLSLQTKFTIALISIVVLPAFLTVFLFYGRLYNMVVSNTIRQEQDASAKTAPLIERTMDTILATTRNITGQNFFQFHNVHPFNCNSSKWKCCFRFRYSYFITPPGELQGKNAKKFRFPQILCTVTVLQQKFARSLCIFL